VLHILLLAALFCTPERDDVLLLRPALLLPPVRSLLLLPGAIMVLVMLSPVPNMADTATIVTALLLGLFKVMLPEIMYPVSGRTRYAVTVYVTTLLLPTATSKALLTASFVIITVHLNSLLARQAVILGLTVTVTAESLEKDGPALLLLLELVGGAGLGGGST
jgi:hypothetical protein